MLQLRIQNFRSIKDADVDLAPITVLYGANGSGKSSLLYSLLLLKNVLLNLERRTGDFYDLGFANLGDFRAVVHGHDVGKSIHLNLNFAAQDHPLRWEIRRGEEQLTFALSSLRNDGLDLKVTNYSYPENEPEFVDDFVKYKNAPLHCVWDGFRGKAEITKTINRTNEEIQNAAEFNRLINAPEQLLRGIAIAPLQMAFSTVAHTVQEDASLHSNLYFSEDQVGTLLAKRRYLQSPVSHALEKITGRLLRVFYTLENGAFSINAEDRDTGFETELVNDGYGVNRLAWLLALTLHDETKWMCIEEPETHLHPSAIRNLMREFVAIMREKEKRFLLTTHSEALVLALLSEVARGNLQPDEIAFYLTHKEGMETRFERQQVNERGQVAGGLASFMEGEMEELSAFFERAN